MYPQGQQQFAGYAAAAAGNAAWSQAQQHANQQNMPYAVQYSSDGYDKSFASSYPVPYDVVAAGGDGMQMAQGGYYAQQYVYAPQTYTQGYQPAMGVYYDRRGAAFNPGAPPPQPNYAHPPPRNDEMQSLTMFEAPQQSSAAYTASWVSSTSSIPPELKDSPESLPFADASAQGSTNGAAAGAGAEYGQQWNNDQRDDLAAGASAVLTPPVAAAADMADRFADMTIGAGESAKKFGAWGQKPMAVPMGGGVAVSAMGVTGGVPAPPENGNRWQGGKQTVVHGQVGQHMSGHWPGLGDKEDRSEKRLSQRGGGEREPRELTWEERIKKGSAIKERFERERSEREEGAQLARRGAPRTGRGGRGGSSRGGANGTGDRGQQQQGAEWQQGQQQLQQAMGGVVAAMAPPGSQMMGGGGVGVGGPGMPPPPLPPQTMMGMGMFPPRMFMRPPPVIEQDQRFSNTWLDANMIMPPFPILPSMMPGGGPPMGGMRGRGRGRGSRSGMGRRREERGEGEETSTSATPDATPTPREGDSHEGEGEEEEARPATGQQVEEDASE